MSTKARIRKREIVLTIHSLSFSEGKVDKAKKNLGRVGRDVGSIHAYFYASMTFFSIYLRII